MVLYGLYNLVLLVLLVFFSPMWGVLLWRFPKMRAGFWEKLGFYKQSFTECIQALPHEKRVWVHAVSVGEFHAARLLIARLQRLGFSVLLSTTTATGQQLARQQYPDLPVFYFPFDLPWALVKAFNRLQPSIVIILETEIWPNFLMLAHHHQIPVLLANGRLSERSFRCYLFWKSFLGPVINKFSRILMQSAGDADRMRRLGASEAKLSVMGNLKYEVSPEDKNSGDIAAVLRGWEGFPVLAFASTHAGEENAFLDLYRRLIVSFSTLRIVLAPRHPERLAEVLELVARSGLSFVKRTNVEQVIDEMVQVMVLDTMGELCEVFSFSKIALMGGSFIPWGGHNPLEPIQAGIPVVFGPYMANFEDIVRAVSGYGAGFQVDSMDEAETQIACLLARPALYEEAVRGGQRLIAEHQGAAENVVAAIENVFSSP